MYIFFLARRTFFFVLLTPDFFEKYYLQYWHVVEWLLALDSMVANHLELGLGN